MPAANAATGGGAGRVTHQGSPNAAPLLQLPLRQAPQPETPVAWPQEVSDVALDPAIPYQSGRAVQTDTAQPGQEPRCDFCGRPCGLHSRRGPLPLPQRSTRRGPRLRWFHSRR